ncbi:MAG: EpsG family protein [Burkholderiaceae bacterium]
MWPYWLLFLVPAVAAVLKPKPRFAPASFDPTRWGLEWLLVLVLLALMIGFRVEVGGDWGSYIRYLDRVQGAPLDEVITSPDPGYELVNWVSVELGWGVFGVNLFCGSLLAVGLVYFCRNMPRPWLALAVTVPYLIIVVGMGYSRQGVALGLAMLGLVALMRKSTVPFVVFVLLGATFHKTAVILLPIAALASTHNRYWTAAWVGVITLLAYQLFLEDSVEGLVAGYIEAEYQSQGALVRLVMNALPAGLLLLWRKRFRFTGAETNLWLWLAVISLALLAVLFVSPSSTAVDRIALYMLPLQLVVFSHIPDVLGRRASSNQGWVAAVVAYYALVNFVWLNYASHAEYWLPYRFLPFEGL